MTLKNVIEVEHLSKEYIDGVGYKITLLKDISFNVIKGSFTSIIAPTGSGKTTLVKIISGLSNPTKGSVNNLTDIKAVYIPSKSSSFPWFNVKDNIVFGLKNTDGNNLKELIRLIGLEGYEEHYPHNKSVGFRFRISLAMALVRNPNIIVLDEPFNQMDTETKLEIYGLIKKLNQEQGITFLLATTNITEAVLLSNKVYLMKGNPGEIVETIEYELVEDSFLNLFNSKKYNEIRKKVEDVFKSHDTQKLLTLSI